ncbi:LVIVD repeat-containing protein [Nocardia sp. GCM10030253]|uniref:LVIVD repeat-containing protein n=1 Tax=Nocardia sp. GCM10030253 TaxID=3273404 RepID=UPI00363A1936
MKSNPAGNRTRARAGAVLAAVILLPGGVVAAQPPNTSIQQFDSIAADAAAAAQCGPGSAPETGLQGDVPAADRASGRSTQGYRCNITRIGGFEGAGGGLVSAAFDHCAYIGSFFPGSLNGPSPGVQVLDVSEPANPVRSTTLTEPAMLAGTWETLKVNTRRKLLVGAGAPVLAGAGMLSIYDISDCAHPRLLNPGVGSNIALPLNITAHEGGFSPDGMTYWSSGTVPGIVSAVDLADPASPRVLWQGMPGISIHGMGVSADGNQVFLADNTGGLTVLDSSAVQRRDPDPRLPILSQTKWTDGWATQHAVPVVYDGNPYLFAVDEAGSGGVKIIDVADAARPRLAGSIKLEINLAANQDAALASSMGGSIFSYDPHYCAADRPKNPTALACAWLASGIRVFDVRDPHSVREIAYYNPPARTGRPPGANSPQALFSVAGVPVLSSGSIIQALNAGVFDPATALGPRSDRVPGDMSADLCFSPPSWHGDQLWVACSDNTFQTLRLDSSVYTPPPDQETTIGS